MKNTIKILSIILLFNSYVNIAKAQDNQNWEDKREQIKAEKIAYITTQVQFTPAEAEKFWPIYNQMLEEKANIIKQYCPSCNSKNKPDPKTLTDEQAQKLLDQDIQKEAKIYAMGLKYYEEYKKILSPKKIYLLYEAETNFKKELLKKVNNTPKK